MLQFSEAANPPQQVASEGASASKNESLDDDEQMMEESVSEDEYLRRKEQARELFVAGDFTAAYSAYQFCAQVCAFKDQLVTLYTNMAMCSIRLMMYERAFFDCQRALELQKGT